MLTEKLLIMVKNRRELSKFSSPNKIRSIRRSISDKTGVNVIRTVSSTSSNANIKVVVRVRPLNDKEKEQNDRVIVQVVDKNSLIFDPKVSSEPFYYHGVPQRGRDLLKRINKNIEFNFDYVFNETCNNADVFSDSTKDLISSLMDGFNCSVFVYGATGAGKTFTMLGNTGSPGITLLTMEHLFQRMRELNDERDFDLGITYLEVYNETVKDLLNPGGPLHLREDNYGVCVAGIEMKKIKTADELFALLKEGNLRRTQHPTDANSESSRSHAVFQVYVNMYKKKTGQRSFSKLSMIDLAGSERGAATGCTGMRFTEGANINKSLLALGNCINSLADGRSHIPYRDSKLTRLLKDSLGGNCQTVMIANISPSPVNYEDTYNTLKYATRAKKIKSTMKKNEVSVNLSLAQYKKIVEELNREIESWKGKVKNLEQTISSNSYNNAIDSAGPSYGSVVTSSSMSVSSVVSSSSAAAITSNSEIVTDNNFCSNCLNNNRTTTTVTPKLNKLNINDVTKEEENSEKLKRRKELLSLYEQNTEILRNMCRLKYTQVYIQSRMKLRPKNNKMFSIFNTDNNEQSQLNCGYNTANQSVRELSAIATKLVELEKENAIITEKIQRLVEENNIRIDGDSDILQYKLTARSSEHELHVVHTDKMLAMYSAELEQKNKVISRAMQMLTEYFQLLRAHDRTTRTMEESYNSMIRMAQGIRTVSFSNDENGVNDCGGGDGCYNENYLSNYNDVFTALDIDSHHVNSETITKRRRLSTDNNRCVAFDTTVTITTPLSNKKAEQQHHQVQQQCARTTVKRKLYDANDYNNMLAVSPTLMTTVSTVSLNETVTFSSPTMTQYNHRQQQQHQQQIHQSPINADAINNTFCLRKNAMQKTHKPRVPKKGILADRSNTVGSDHLLQRPQSVQRNKIGVKRPLMHASPANRFNNKNANNKYLGNAFSKTQQFPLRKNKQQPPSTATTTATVNSFRNAVNRPPIHRFITSTNKKIPNQG